MHHTFELCLYLTIHSLLDVLEPPILDKQMRKAEDDLKKTEVNTKLLIQVILSVLEWLYQHFLLIFSENSNFSAVIPVLDYQQLKLALKKKESGKFFLLVQNHNNNKKGCSIWINSKYQFDCFLNTFKLSKSIWYIPMTVLI